MDCRFAYMKQDIEYVLCKKEPTPSRQDRTALFHAMCGHQAHCPKQNCHKLTASWKRCVKLAERNQAAYEAVLAEPLREPAGPAEKPKRSRRKPKADE